MTSPINPKPTIEELASDITAVVAHIVVRKEELKEAKEMYDLQRNLLNSAETKLANLRNAMTKALDSI